MRPDHCCRERLKADLANYETVITLGDEAYKAVMPGNPKLGPARGAPAWIGEDHE